MSMHPPSRRPRWRLNLQLTLLLLGIVLVLATHCRSPAGAMQKRERAAGVLLPCAAPPPVPLALNGLACGSLVQGICQRR